ncbi:MAG: hypothetical protein ACI9SP_001664 [Arenicella sp.]|jgi:hypothetical protein
MRLKNITGKNIMKNLSISLALIVALSASQGAFAELKKISPSPTSGIEKIVVVAQPEVANFEIFSLKRGEQAIHQIMDIVAASLDSDKAVTVQPSSKTNVSI